MFILAPHILFLLNLLGVGMSHHSPAMMLFSVLFYLAGLFLTYRRNLPLHRNAEPILAMLALIATLASSEITGQHYLFSLQYWLAIMLILRSYRRMEKREYAFSFLISAALFAHVGRTYEDVPFLFLVLANILIAPYALYYFQLRFGIPPSQTTSLPAARPPILYLLSVSASLLITTILLFLIIPRPQSSTGGLFEDKQNRLTGFSESLELGTFNKVIDQKNIVLTVESDIPALWRAEVLDFYDHGTWKTTAPFFGTPPATQSIPSGTPQTIRRTFSLFDVRLSSFKLLSAGNVLSLDSAANPWFIKWNPLYSSLHLERVSQLNQFNGAYTLITDNSEYLLPAQLQKRAWPHPLIAGRWINEADLFLQLPSDLTPAVRKLAAEITKNASSIADKADAVQTYLTTNLQYSRDNLASGSMTPLDYFLFQSRKGHCEYFATAMAILLRCEGVHTRVVQGFSTGTLLNDRYVVRLSDAHLWVEVFFPGKGWKTYDPTPTVEGDSGRPRYSIGWMEKLQLQWQTYVLQYSGVKQARVLDYIRESIITLIHLCKTFRHPLLLTLFILAAGSLLIMFARLYQRLSFIPGSTRTNREKKSMQKARHDFARYLKEISRKGYRREPGTTPNDLLLLMENDRVPVLKEARLITALFYKSRFGGEDLSPQDLQHLHTALRHIRHWSQ